MSVESCFNWLTALNILWQGLVPGCCEAGLFYSTCYLYQIQTAVRLLPPNKKWQLNTSLYRKLWSTIKLSRLSCEVRKVKLGLRGVKIRTLRRTQFIRVERLLRTPLKKMFDSHENSTQYDSNKIIKNLKFHLIMKILPTLILSLSAQCPWVTVYSS